ncbi:Pentapeptide repeats (8 copies) [Pseudovibrio sp. W64]|uniref:pentapeptide repeat-containing protein n=1 Tax=Pseudovibrio sp. W64 TaxID=1735583 RepID=UPI0007AE6C91|nr:pentapeptide repeat-containing protein [Pseudovibrio sp. W64]KZK78316.1 Pentapeptide repeats (8 copies) [Pseudovibrio sp. W64]
MRNKNQRDQDHTWNIALILSISSLLTTLVGVIAVNLTDFETSKLLRLEFWGGSNPAFSVILRNIGLMALGLAGLYLAWDRTQTATRQADLAERGQNTDRFQKAAAMLGDRQLSVREAGIYALTELAQSDPQHHYLPIQKLLCSFIRDRSADQEQSERNLIENGKLEPFSDNACYRQYHDQAPSDIAEAAIAFSTLRTSDNILLEKDWEPDLKGVNLKGTDLSGSNFQNVNFRWANFEGAQLIAVNFDNSQLFLANLATRLTRANLNNSYLFGANLEGAELNGATWQGSDLKKYLQHINSLSFTVVDHAQVVEFPKKFHDQLIVWNTPDD